MKEQSHKQDMAQAVRGDFARLRARGVATTIAVPGETTADVQPPAGEPPAAERPRRRRFLRRF